MNISLLLAWRYIRQSTQEKSVSTMALICFMGMLIGACALALVVSVMSGFEKATHEKLQGIHSQIIMRSGGQDLDIEKIGTVLTNEFPEVALWSPSTIKQVIIQKSESNDLSNVVVIKGINPEKEAQISTIAHKIIDHAPQETTMPALLQNNRIMIGKTLADTLQVKVGDTVSFVYPESTHSGKKMSLAQTEVVIGGIFKTGIDEFDSSFVLACLALIKQLFPDSEITQIHVQLHPNASESKTIAKLAQRFGIDVFSWKDLYPALVAALTLEKYVMFFILALITLVASMNIISLLFMQITRKRADIAILKSMGMSDAQIRRIFLSMGLFIALAGTLCGLALAWAIGLLLQRYPFIELPDTYYVSHLPVTLDIAWFGIIFITVMLISLISILLPLSSLKKIKIADVLRFEG